MRKEQVVDFVKRNRRLVAAGSAAGIILVSFGAFALLPERAATPVATDAVRYAANEPQHSEPPRMVESGTPFSFADLVERVSPAVVSITAEEMQQVNNPGLDGPMADPFFRQFFRQFGPQAQPQVQRAVSMGSGFIIDKKGLIVTNNHVIEGSKKIKVKLPDGRTFDAKLVGADPATDVALLKVNPDKPLPTVEFGNDRRLRVGDWVVAVGNPFGLSNTVTAGIVSSIGRDINNDQPYTDFIQIDAPINRGNSGGPTFDLHGEVVGMNSMIFSPSGGSVGIGFAIPSSTIKDVVAQLEAHGRVSRGWLGVQIQSLTPEMAASLGLGEPKGAIVAGVVPDSPAAKAGFHQGDVVLGLNGRGVDSSQDMTRRVALLPAGKAATFTIMRDGNKQNLSVVIGQKKEDQIASLNAQQGPESPASAVTGKAMGLALSAVTPDVRRAYNLDDNVQGVLITKVDPDSDGADKGLQAGDILLSVNNHTVRTPQDVEKSVAAAHTAGRKSVLLLVASDGISRFVAVDLGKT